MDSENRSPSAPLASQSTSSPTPQKSRLDAVRAFLRNRWRRILFVCLAFLPGLLCGVIGVVVILFVISPDSSVVVNPPAPGTNAIVVQGGTAYITHLVDNALQTSGLPGSIQHVQVTLARGDQATIRGVDQITILGIGTTRNFTIIIQPYVASCQVKVHVLHVDLGGIAVTAFASQFEGQINTQIQVNTSKLPAGFTYCTTSVRTDPQGVFVTYSAIPKA